MPTKKKTAAAAPVAQTYIVTDSHRDLWYGEVADPEAMMRDGHGQIARCRHIAYWRGPKGGLTSLAVEGPEASSRIGRPAESAWVRDVVAVLAVSEAAAGRFGAV